MIDTLNAHFESRIEELPELKRARVMKRISEGATTASRYETATNYSRCVLSGEVPEILWTVAFSPDEANALGSEINNVLNSLPTDAQLAIDDALDEGAGIVAAVEHQTHKAEIYLEQNGKATLLAAMQVPAPVWQ